MIANVDELVAVETSVDQYVRWPIAVRLYKSFPLTMLSRDSSDHCRTHVDDNNDEVTEKSAVV